MRRYLVTVKHGKSRETFEIEVEDGDRGKLAAFRILKEKIFKKRARESYRIISITKLEDE